MAKDYITSDLAVVSYERLQRKDDAEVAKLFSACVESGFFYLDLGEPDSEDFLADVDALFDVTRRYFSKPLEEKMKDQRSDFAEFNICGYKPMGLDQGVVGKKKDGCEGMRVPLDALASDTHLPIPNGIKPDWPTVSKFMKGSYSITTTVLETLSDSLGLTGSDRLENSHRLDTPSQSTAVLQSYPVQGLGPDISQGHFTHTDAGSVSVLFCSDWGLQVCELGDDDQVRWSYVAPRPGCAVVNVGDSLRFLSGQRFKSCLHRVVPCDRWTSGTRYSVIFFLRPNNDASFVDGEGRRWTGSTWLNSKFGNYRNSHEEQKHSAMSTGARGFLGLWEQ